MKEAQLDTVAQFVRGVTFKGADVEEPSASNVDCLRTKNVQAVLDTGDVWSIARTHVKKEDQYLRHGDVLISSANSWNLVGKCCWIPELERVSTFGGFVTVLRPNPELIEPRYLYRWFSSGSVQSTVRSFANQTTNISNLDLKRTARLKVPVPKLEEQRRIAAILDKADDLRAKRRQAIARLDALTQSIFSEMFEASAADWPRVELRDLCEVTSGITKGRKTTSEDLTPYPYLAVSNVQDRSLNMAVVKQIAVSAAEADRFRLMRGDLLLTEGGDADKLGRGTIWNDELPWCLHQNHVFRVRPNSPRVIPVFLSWYLSAPAAKSYFLRMAKQTTGIASINKTQLSTAPVRLPPLELQQAFATRVAAVERLKETHRKHLAELGALFASLQNRAFKGEL
ncbi:restriction endonuclease subunit S [Paenarthrobacter nicotinovorans]|uniref:restriction endonuclease subunit S n=1 Tax=Paenarthrobacter nicotinovorans TaxID=29320 RepID=UPI00380F1CB6